MSVSAYIHGHLVDLLEESRVVVWSDAEGTMRELAVRFKAPNCQLVDTSDGLTWRSTSGLSASARSTKKTAR